MNGQPKETIDAEHGVRYWRLNDLLHREDGPAWEDWRGQREWFLNGQRHRIDGPATEYTNGAKLWYFEGKRHRTDGPAIIHADGTTEWFLNDEKLTYSEWKYKTTRFSISFINTSKEATKPIVVIL